MPTFGGLAPFPRRYGGGTPGIKTIADSLSAQLGTAYNTTDTTGIVYIRIQALARVIWAAWCQNQRLANQWDPVRMTDFLPRWEKIYGLAPNPGDSLSVRRARVGVAMARVGYGTARAVFDACTAFLGPCFVGVVTNSSAGANVWTPAGWPMGAHPATASQPDWYSSVAHIVVLTTQPATMPDDEFYATIGSVKPVLDGILPSWVTFDVLKDGPGGAAAGFILDDPHNLDLERFL